MSRAMIVLDRPSDRAKAARWVAGVSSGTRLEFKAPRRTLDQNSLMWVLLTELAEQLRWHEQKYTPDDWKDYMMHALRKARWMPDEDGGMVPIGMRTSDLAVSEMGDLIEIIRAFGARHGVVFHDPNPEAA